MALGSGLEDLIPIPEGQAPLSPAGWARARRNYEGLHEAWRAWDLWKLKQKKEAGFGLGKVSIFHFSRDVSTLAVSGFLFLA